MANIKKEIATHNNHMIIVKTLRNENVALYKASTIDYLKYVDSL